MAKFTAKYVRDGINNLFIDLTPNSLVVSEKKKNVKTKKVEVVIDDEATVHNLEGNLLYYRGLLDATLIFEDKFPEGILEIVNGHMADWETLRAYFEEKYPDEYEAFAELFSIEGFDDIDAEEADEESEEEVDEEEAVDYSEMSLGDLRAECKERGIKYTPKDKVADLAAKLEENDAEAEDEEEPEEEEETSDYSEMSLSELRAECKERGIKYTPKDKEETLVAKLEENDAESEEEEADEEAEEENAYAEMSLGDLRKLAKERGIKYTPKTTAEELAAKLVEYDEENGEDEEAEEEEEETEEEEASDYSEMSIAELRAECKERGIKYTPKMKDAELIELLEASDAEESEDEEEADEEGEDEIDESELDEVLDEEFEDETFDEEEEKTSKGGKAGKSGNKDTGKKLPPKPNKKK